MIACLDFWHRLASIEDPPYKGNTSIKPSKSFFNNNNSSQRHTKLESWALGHDLCCVICNWAVWNFWFVLQQKTKSVIAALSVPGHCSSFYFQRGGSNQGAPGARAPPCVREHIHSVLEVSWMFSQQNEGCSLNIIKLITGYILNVKLKNQGCILNIKLQKLECILNVKLQNVGCTPYYKLQKLGCILNFKLQNVGCTLNVKHQNTRFHPECKLQNVGCTLILILTVQLQNAGGTLIFLSFRNQVAS